MTTAQEIELLISRLGVLFWQLNPDQTSSADDYEQQLYTFIWENLNHVSVTSCLPTAFESDRSTVSVANHVCPIF